MCGLKLSLQILIYLESVPHLVVYQKLVRYRQRHQKLCSISLSLELLKTGNDPKEYVLNGSLIAMNDIPLEIGVEIGGVA